MDCLVVLFCCEPDRRQPQSGCQLLSDPDARLGIADWFGARAQRCAGGQEPYLAANTGFGRARADYCADIRLHQPDPVSGSIGPLALYGICPHYLDRREAAQYHTGRPSVDAARHRVDRVDVLFALPLALADHGVQPSLGVGKA